eukprot:2538145-Alexandrium_andersonii.AAC.1
MAPSATSHAAAATKSCVWPASSFAWAAVILPIHTVAKAGQSALPSMNHASSFGWGRLQASGTPWTLATSRGRSQRKPERG